jgi:sterol desaturase/sphingolipid hydroxylase (fatty acid hydroxylase superfamily)
MQSLIDFYSASMSATTMLGMAVSAAGLLLAAAMRRPGALGRLSLANSAVSIGFWAVHVLLVPATALLLLGITTLFNVDAWPRLAPGQIAVLPFWAQLILLLLIDDFTEYWAHRGLHSPWAWPLHAIHHSDTSVNGFTTFRVHSLEPLVIRLCSLVTLGWIGFSPELIAVAVAINLIHNCYVHFDLDWDHGPLRWLIASPRFHRLHHLDVPAVHKRNLANKFPFWDIMFGTYAGTGRMAGSFGATMSGVPDTDLVRLWLWPFVQWAGMLKQRLRLRPRHS